MTRDEILNMPAGREMDYTIMWYFYTDKTKDGLALNGYDYSMWMKCTQRDPKNYSTEIAWAWEILLAMGKNGYIWDLQNNKGRAASYTFCSFYKGRAEWHVIADTAPLAICRAALLAVMEAE